jgi:hypothetical protein
VYSLAHDLFRKPVPTFQDHALSRYLSAAVRNAAIVVVSPFGR